MVLRDLDILIDKAKRYRKLNSIGSWIFVNLESSYIHIINIHHDNDFKFTSPLLKTFKAGVQVKMEMMGKKDAIKLYSSSSILLFGEV